ncbi:thioredoxin-disulfide reductase [Candidatus Woesearchaeota archaeon]|jgi:thioredoxin reductase (NADPH)|nr:thioredoxin-disulfide reductase [Candidatus Woesearchaeota archaeon]|tara:strand:- start:1718 stop:2653 length:936 start_codon:yes stop_codon:yes gene_type:complete
MHDVIIIGAGAAGLTAAIYTCRKKLKTLILSIDVGGQTNLTSHIENYPGTGAMHGVELMRKFQDEAIGFGAELVMGKANKAEKTEKGFKIGLANGESYECKALILAYGKVPKSLGIEGEEKFMGRGVSTCVTCDAPLFKNREVAVIGGGNSAVEGALELATIAKKVYLIHRRDKFRADEITVEKINKNPKIEPVLNSVSLKINGDKNVEGITVENIPTKEKKDFKVDGVFIEIGYVVDTSFVQHLVKVNEKKEIIVDNRGNTSHPGIFSCGDITPVPYKQTVIAAGEGSKAALECYKWLTGGKGAVIDWTH